ncbi:4612_t:CDS:2 [Entrophospora sp. SA101]|nr:4612_t:CDS:2 [Entrophospora sp. SA101]
MSNTPLPSVEEVNKWKRNDVTKFLQDKKEELDLDDEDIDIIKRNRVAGRAFLEVDVNKLMQDGLKRGPAEAIAGLVRDIKGEGQEQKLQAGPRVVEFWKKLLDAKIVFPIPQDMEEDELNGLESYYTIENNHVCLNNGVITDSDGMLYNNGEITDLQLPSKLMDNFGGMLCLPDGVFFLGEEYKYGSKLLIRNCYLQLLELIEKNRKPGLSAHTGCTITGTPGIGKTYFGLFILFYVRYRYPKATIIWRGDENNCYQFLSEGDVQERDFHQFSKTLNNAENFYIADAHVMTWCSAYKILLTSPMVERFNEAVKWPGFTQYFMPVWTLEEITALWTVQYKNRKNEKGEEFTFELVGSLLDKWGPIPRSVLLKWDDETYQQKYYNLIAEADLESCVNSINKAGMPTDTVSGRLVHLDVNPTFIKVVYRFASPMISNIMIQAYETKNKKKLRDFIMSSHEHPMVAGFRGNLFEDLAHLELQRGGTFRIRCLNNNNLEATERHIKESECNWFMTLNEARKEYYNRPKSKTFASIDSFSLDNNTLALYQITVSTDHGIKVKGLNDLDRFLTWKRDVDNINLYFVVPSDIFEEFSFQKYKTVKDQGYQKIPKWINNINQYALEVAIRRL